MQLASRSTDSFTLPGRVLFAASLVTGSAAAWLYQPRLALVAAACVFGWTQIAGL